MKITLFIGTVLLISALIVGGAIFYQRVYHNRSLSPFSKQEDKKEETKVADLLKESTPSAQRIGEVVSSQGKEAEILAITNCMGTPEVWKIKATQSLKIKNSDQEKHTIFFTDKIKVEINGGETKEVKNDLLAGSIYPYECATADKVSQKRGTCLG